MRFLFSKEGDESAHGIVEEFKKINPNFSYGMSLYRSDLWKYLVQPKRRLFNYRHFLVLKHLPFYYAERLIRYLPWWMKPFVKLPGLNLNFLIEKEFVGKFLDLVENVVPPDQEISQQIRAYEPDVVVATLGDLATVPPDQEYIKAAKFFNIPSALFVYSWDQLDIRAFIHVLPDALLTWNESQAEVAEKQHGIPKEIIRIAGAPIFDQWFSEESRTSLSREEFCKKYALRPEDPIIVFFNSSGIVKNEEIYFAELRSALDRHPDPRMKKIQFVVRPHPKGKPYKMFKYFEEHGVPVFPKDGALPSRQEDFRLFYDTLYHSIAHVAICSSASIDGILAGKPGITMLSPRYEVIQKESPHYKHLMESGAIDVVENPDSFAGAVLRILNGEDRLKENRLAFIKKYVRPLGLDKSAGEAVAESLEKLWIRN